MSLLTRLLVLLIVILPTLNASAQPTRWSSYQLDSLLYICQEQILFHPDNALALALQLLDHTKYNGDTTLIAKTNYLLGKAYSQQGNSKKALHYLEESVRLSNFTGDKKNECSSLKEIGTVYNNRGESDEALSYYSKALAVAKEASAPDEVIAITNNIGTLFSNKGHYDKAIEYYQEGMNLQPDNALKATLLANMGKAMMGKDKLNEALEYCQASVEASQTLSASDRINALNALASVYFQMAEDEEVLKVSLKLLALINETGLKTEKVEALNLAGLSYLNLDNPPKAAEYFGKALTVAKEINYPRLYLIHANLAFSYERAESFRLAYQHFRIHKRLEDSIRQVQNNKQIEELLVKYEADKKEQQITLLQQEKQLQDLNLQKQTAELDRQTLIRNTIVIAAFALLIPTLILLIFYRQKMRSKILLAAKTEEVNKQRTLELIREHEIKTIKANLEGREKERERIARELHDGVAGSLAGIKLQLTKVADDIRLGSSMDKVIKNIDGVYQEVRTISHNLSPIKILNTAFIDLLRNQLKQISDNSTFPIDFICYPEDELNQIPDNIKIEVYRIIQELMANIIRHAEATAVEVQFTKTEETINLIIEDMGKGFDTTKVSFGLGLNSIKTRVNNVFGKLHIESIIGRGTIVNIDIPHRANKAIHLNYL